MALTARTAFFSVRRGLKFALTVSRMSISGASCPVSHLSFRASVAVNRLLGSSTRSFRIKSLALRRKLAYFCKRFTILALITILGNVSPVSLMEFKLGLCNFSCKLSLILGLEWLITAKAIQKRRKVMAQLSFSSFRVSTLTLRTACK